MYIYISDLQHTATHCNTLQHTATHRSGFNMSEEDPPDVIEPNRPVKRGLWTRLKVCVRCSVLQCCAACCTVVHCTAM